MHFVIARSYKKTKLLINNFCTNFVKLISQSKANYYYSGYEKTISYMKILCYYTQLKVTYLKLFHYKKL